MIGQTIGTYRVLDKIGEGGMGEVYRARDTKLGRDVALKVLPEAFAQDPDRLARFQREAQLLASLNHPNIAQIYGIEDTQRQRPHGVEEREVGGEVSASVGTIALVMELVEGPTLDEVIRGATGAGGAMGAAGVGLQLADALPIARQIADALEAAHEQGIIHRDLKPANVKVRDDGTVKVLDFGLAKALAPEAGAAVGRSGSVSMSPTITTPAMTQLGVILGTAAYMAPEQAKGRTVDKRADIWAFGCVLYEMLSGRRPFAGEDISDTLANVLKLEPDWSALPADLPPRVLQVLRACLQKAPKQRLADIQDVRLALEGVFDTPAAQMEAPAPPTRPLWQPVALMLAAALVGAAVVWVARQPAGPVPQRLSVVLPDGYTIANVGSPGRAIAISPDGRTVAFSGTNRNAPAGERGGLRLRSLDNVAIRDLPGTTGASQPFFSPDGRWVAFFTGAGELKKVALGGGSPVTLAEDINGASWSFGAWIDDDTIVFSHQPGIGRMSADGGPIETLASIDRTAELRFPYMSSVPESRAVLITVQSQDAAYHVEALRVDTGERSVIVENARDAHYLRGRLLFQRDESFLVAPFDPARLVISGSLVPITDAVGVNLGGEALLAVSASGTLAYQPATDIMTMLGLVSRTGVFEPLDAPRARYDRLAASPDGTRVALAVQPSEDQFTVDVYDLTRGSRTRLTQAGSDAGPSWRPDGRALAVTSLRPGAELALFIKELGGAERRLVSGEGALVRNTSWSPDGTVLAYTLQRANEHDIWTVTTDEAATATALIAGPAAEHSPRFSPDGQWLAYVSNESGRPEIYVRGYPTGEVVPVSTSGGSGPIWSRDGRELFFEGREDGTPVMMSVAISAVDGAPRIGVITKLFEFRATDPVGRSWEFSTSTNGGQRWDVLPDGRFVMFRTAAREANELIVAQNWIEELDRSVPTD